jgi:hypothetical protein
MVAGCRTSGLSVVCLAAATSDKCGRLADVANRARKCATRNSAGETGISMACEDDDRPERWWGFTAVPARPCNKVSLLKWERGCTRHRMAFALSAFGSPITSQALQFVVVIWEDCMVNRSQMLNAPSSLAGGESLS